jgi:hypothetical protein
MVRFGWSSFYSSVRVLMLAGLAVVVLGSPASAQASGSGNSDEGFWDRWFRQSDKSKAEQPHWITPLATTTPRLEQEFRYDVQWQQAKPGTNYTQNYGNTKGLELIPFEAVEIIAAVPPYIVHHSATLTDGFGDFQLLVKYRLLSANAEHGDYILTAFVSSTFPTSTTGNGNPKAIVTPTLAYGKGFGDFDIQGTIAAAVPAADESTLGKSYVSNNTFQLRLLERIWPELEVNTTWFQDGKNDGKHQVFLTPGVVLGRFPLNDRVGLTVGAGVQVAVSQFHTSDHNIIFSARLPF